MIKRSFYTYISIILGSIILLIGVSYIYFYNENTICKNTIMNTKVEVYIKNNCIFCRKTKELLNKKNIHFEEYNVSNCVKTTEQMVERTKGKTKLPQIFIHGIYIGSYEDIKALNNSGQLDNLIKAIK